MRADQQLLERVQMTLEDARQALKKLAHASSITEDAVLSEEVAALRSKFKKVQKRARVVEAAWMKKATG